VNTRKQPTKKKNRLKAFFVRGLLTVLPIVFTVFILVVAFGFVRQYVTGPVNTVIYWALERNGAGWQCLEWLGIDPYSREFYAEDLPSDLEKDLRDLTSDDPQYALVMKGWRDDNERFFRELELLGVDHEELHDAVILYVNPLVGLGVSLLLVLSLGSFAGGIIGRTFLSRGDRALNRIPIVRSIYPYTKQLTDFFLAERKFDFDTVVAVEYPRRGLRSIGFVTSSALKTLRDATGQNLVSVFVPSSPMPMTGYTIFVPAEDLIPLPFTVDEALRTVVSGGVLIPPHEKVDITAFEAMAKAHSPKLASDASDEDERVST
jgi:uncharacterized membrane protein